MSEPEHTTGNGGPPSIERVQAKIANLERMMDWLDERIEGGQGSAASLNHDRANRSALKYALLALRHYDADMRGLDLPILALDELVRQVERWIDDDAVGPQSEMHPAMERAREALRAWADQ